MIPEVQEIKTQLRVLRNVLYQEMEDEYTKRSRDLRGQLEEVAYRLYNTGMSVSAVGRAMGTRHWKTTRDLLDAAIARREGPVKPEGSFTISRLPADAHGPDHYAVQVWAWTSETETVAKPYTGTIAVRVVRSPVLAVVPYAHEGFDVGTPLHSELAAWRIRTSPVVEAFKKEAGLKDDPPNTLNNKEDE